MLKAIGILGSDAAVTKLHASLRNKGIALEKQNFWYPEDILAHLEENPDIAAVIVVERAVDNPANTLESIRAGDPTVRIVFIKETPDSAFEQWCYQRLIYDIVYPSRQTDVNVDAIGDAICLGRIDPEHLPELPSDPLDTAERIPLLDKLKGITLPEIRLPAMPEIQLPAFNRRTNTEPRTYKTIGVINCSRGMGATTLAVNLAQCLIAAGRSVSILVMDNSQDLSCIDGIPISFPSHEHEWETTEYQHIIMDFGTPYNILPSGAVLPACPEAGLARMVENALKECEVQFCLFSDEPWHIFKAKAFESDPKKAILRRDEANAAAILQELGVI